MKNEVDCASSKAVIKKLLFHFGCAFLFVLWVLAVNQFTLMFFHQKAGLNFSQNIILFLYIVPALITTGIPFAVCLGFTFGFIKINIREKLSQDKMIILPIFILTLIIALFSFAVSDLIMPVTNEKAIKMYQGGSLENERAPKQAKEMSSLKIAQRVNELDEDKILQNYYTLELHKRYAIPSGVLFFCFFALSLSLFLQKYLKIGLCVSLISCIAYWALLTYGQDILIPNGRHGVLAVWLPNIVLLSISMLLCVIKYKMRRR